MVSKYVWPLVTSLFIALLGAALLIWPFAIHTNTGGWTHATTADFWSGVGIAVIGLISAATWFSGLRQDLIAQGLVAVKQRQSVPAGESQQPVGQSDADLDRLLRPLAETVLQDLTRQLANKGNRSNGGGGTLS
ncbi:MAG: hypothetical protein C7B45_05265 [Sulfobacillus acidophilus]|uniref:Uncharacterized protein n=1 Tax=Sulfobacillus acidophilus TaxID=53633 RepID=A0A2T2WKX6_9FIRM|nr:MAG: hypothetical protein C7B45_05265 [Sulfobacillus acidophilus]